MDSCIERGGSGSGDSRRIINFFLSFVNKDTGENFFTNDKYDPKSFMQEYIDGNQSVSKKFSINHSYHGKDLIIGPLELAGLNGGLSEPGVLVSKGPFNITSKLIFSENDVDTIHSVVTCRDNCNYEEKTLEMYYNGTLILDLDFSGKDSLLLEELLDNNRFPFGDTVVFVIEKNP